MHNTDEARKEDSSVLRTVKAYRDLACDVANRVVLVKDSTCLHFLVFVLGESNVDCIVVALETLWYLSEQKQYRKVLMGTYYLIKALDNIITTSNEKVSSYPERVVNLCKGIEQRLVNSTRDKEGVVDVAAVSHVGPGKMPSYLEESCAGAGAGAAHQQQQHAVRPRQGRAQERRGWLAAAATFLNHTFYW